MKITIEYVREFMKKEGCELLTDVYSGNMEKLDIIARCGHPSTITWHSFKAGQGRNCIVCTRKGSAEKRKLSLGDVIKIIESKGCKLLDNNYVDSKTELKILFACNHIGYRNLSDFKASSPNCKECAPNAKLDVNDVIKEFENYGLIFNRNDWHGTKSLMTLEDKLGYKYYLTYDSFRMMVGRNGSFEIVGKSNPYTIENIKKWISINNKKYEYISGEFVGANDRTLAFRCLECNKNWISSWSLLIDSSTDVCPECAMKVAAIKSLETRISNKYNLYTEFPFLYDEWDFDANESIPERCAPYSNSKVWWICKNCGNHWQTKIQDRTQKGSGCPVCNFSGGAKRIYEWLKNHSIRFKVEQDFDDLLSEYGAKLRYDFGIYNESNDVVVLIEFDGNQHEMFIPIFHETIEKFELYQSHDKMKDEYADKKGIPLLRIKQKDFKIIEEILEAYLDNLSIL